MSHPVSVPVIDRIELQPVDNQPRAGAELNTRPPQPIRQSSSVSCEVRMPRASFFERNRLAMQKPTNR
jgi:hypothetical protein